MTSAQDNGGSQKPRRPFNKQIDTRFKKGQSGNVKGRPRKKKPAQEADTVIFETEIDRVIIAESYRQITVRENSGEVSMPMMQAVMRSLGVSAVKGNIRAQIAYATIVQEAQARDSARRLSLLEDARDYKKEWSKIFAEAEQQNLPLPDKLPHPDDVFIDLRNEQVIINGPIDEAKKAEWAQADADRRKLWKQMTDLQKELEKLDLDEEREIIVKEMAMIKRRIDVIDFSYPDETIRRRPGFRLDRWRQDHPLAQRQRDEHKDKKELPKKKPL